jgi:hypothetical protein
MDEVITNLLALALSLGVGFVVGYSYGEEHTTTVALKARWEREAKEWDKRQERLKHEL